MEKESSNEFEILHFKMTRKQLTDRLKYLYDFLTITVNYPEEFVERYGKKESERRVDEALDEISYLLKELSKFESKNDENE